MVNRALPSLIFGCLASLGALTVSAEPSSETDLYCARALGYFFYCDPAEAEEDTQPTPAAAPEPTPTPSEKLTAERAAFEEARALMVLEPTPTNVEAYMRAQKRWVDNAAYLTSVSRRVLWANPDLSESVRWPTSQVGRQAEQARERAAERSAIETIAERYGLIYFGAAACDFCGVYEAILTGFADENSLTVLPVSVDGDPLQGFEHYSLDQGQREKLGLHDTVPALALFDSATGEVIPVGYGLLTVSELEHRIRVLTALTPGEEYGVSEKERE